MANEGIVKYKESVYPDKFVVHLAGRRRVAAPAEEDFWLKWGALYAKVK
jgi:hypothetical protein